MIPIRAIALGLTVALTWAIIGALVVGPYSVMVITVLGPLCGACAAAAAWSWNEVNP